VPHVRYDVGGSVSVQGNICEDFTGPHPDISLTNAEQAACAPLAVDILPEVDETNCNISPP
jgi:hypothetical protein